MAFFLLYLGFLGRTYSFFRNLIVSTLEQFQGISPTLHDYIQTYVIPNCSIETYGIPPVSPDFILRCFIMLRDSTIFYPLQRF